MYSQSGYKHQVVIGNQTIIVDSLLEERVIRALEANGFSERWIKPEVGLNVVNNRYTPDLELSVQDANMTHRALVEIKPARQFFTPYISKRMRGVARHYHTSVLLLYVEDENCWYRIDKRTGRLDVSLPPVPGKIPIAKLYKPFSLRSPGVYNHRYRRSAIVTIAAKSLNVIADVVSTVFFGPKKRRRRYRT